MSYAEQYMDEVTAIANQIDYDQIDRLANQLAALRERSGRLFIVGLGGSAASWFASRSIWS